MFQLFSLGLILHYNFFGLFAVNIRFCSSLLFYTWTNSFSLSLFSCFCYTQPIIIAQNGCSVLTQNEKLGTLIDFNMGCEVLCTDLFCMFLDVCRCVYMFSWLLDMSRVCKYWQSHISLQRSDCDLCHFRSTNWRTGTFSLRINISF